MTPPRAPLPITLFLSSPKDVKAERDAVKRVVAELGKTPPWNRRCRIDLLCWEDLVPSELGRPPQMIVDKHMRTAGECDVFVCILCHRMGTPVKDEETGESWSSGTEYEFRHAYKALGQRGRPLMMLYRGHKPTSPDLSDDDLTQYQAVRQFFKQFDGPKPEIQGLFSVFKTTEEFETTFRRELQQQLDNLLQAIEIDRLATVVPAGDSVFRSALVRDHLPPGIVGSLVTRNRDEVDGSSEPAPAREQMPSRLLLQRPLSRAIVAVCVAAGLLVVFLARDRLFPSPPPPPIDLPDWSSKLPAAPVFRLLAAGSPPRPPSGFARPRFRLDLLGRRGNQHFRPLADGDSLASTVDDYLLVVRPETPGYLYVFQLDSQGTLAWLFPSNSPDKHSSGTNPLDAQQRTQIPAEERRTALYLDQNIGVEQVFAVFSATRWIELEESLEQAGGVRGGLPLQQLDLVRGVEVSRGIGGERPSDPGAKSVIDADLKEGKARLELAAREDRAAGWFLIVSRWFRHVAQ